MLTVSSCLILLLLYCDPNSLYKKKANFRRSGAEARRREAWAGAVHIPLIRVCSTVHYSSCKPPLGIVHTPDIVKFLLVGARGFTLRIGGVFHIKSSCLLCFDFVVLRRFAAVASNNF